MNAAARSPSENRGEPNREIPDAGLPILPDLLANAVRCPGHLGPGYEHLAAHLAEMLDRLSHGRFHLAVLGQFKRGKSTLLNALLGDSVLPTAVVPLTAVPTFIRYGDKPGVHIHFSDRPDPQVVAPGSTRGLAEALEGFVTEEANPKNRLNVARVEVAYPAPLLGRGVVMIDTPGIGSTFRHNTEATLNFLPQCDVAMFLVSADPPITEVEVEFLRQVKSKVARLFFILNKVDYLDGDERRAALGFLRRVLHEQAGIGPDVPVFCVSARQGLDARRRGDHPLWGSSGVAAVEEHLVGFLANEKVAALGDAAARRLDHVVGEGLMRLHLAVRAIRMPLEELRERLAVFTLKIEEAQNQRTMAADVLAGDARRIHEFLEEHAAQLRATAQEYLGGIVYERLAQSGADNEDAVRTALAEAIPGFFEHQVGATTELFRQRMALVLKPHQAATDELVESIRRTAAELFDIPYHAPDSTDAFEMVRQPYWVTHQWSSTLNPIPAGWVDRLMSSSVRRRRIRSRVLRDVTRLVTANVENLRWAIFQSIDQTFLQFARALNERLDETVRATHGAILVTVERREQREEESVHELARLNTFIGTLQQIQDAAKRV